MNSLFGWAVFRLTVGRNYNARLSDRAV